MINTPHRVRFLKGAFYGYLTNMQAKIHEAEKIAKVVAKLLKHFDNGNKGNITYINTYKLSKYLASISHKERILISTKMIRQIYETLECITKKLGGWYTKGRYKRVYAIQHDVLSKMTEEELITMIRGCVNHE